MEKKLLYFDCFSGISGDMTVGALLDIGADRDVLLQGLSGLPVDGYHVEIKRGSKKGIKGTDFTVVVDDSIPKLQRHLPDITKIIDESRLNDSIKNSSKKIFQTIAQAEANVHGVSIDEVHFHEVGAVDSIVDIVGTAICIDNLGVDIIWSSPLNLGSGFVQCEHGTIPVPAPATVEILRGVPVYAGDIKKEMTTPTGAAIIKVFSSNYTDIPLMTIERTGYGLGKRDLETPNVLRVILGNAAQESRKLKILETNIDNMNPEIFSYLFPKLLQNGAMDVYVTPVVMKKNRPGNMLSVLCAEESCAAIENIVFRETPTLGVRKYSVERPEMERKMLKVKTSYGEVSVKAAYLNGEFVKFAPEYEECAVIADTFNQPLQKVYQEIMAEAAKELL